MRIKKIDKHLINFNWLKRWFTEILTFVKVVMQLSWWLSLSRLVLLLHVVLHVRAPSLGFLSISFHFTHCLLPALSGYQPLLTSAMLKVFYSGINVEFWNFIVSTSVETVQIECRLLCRVVRYMYISPLAPCQRKVSSCHWFASNYPAHVRKVLLGITSFLGHPSVRMNVVYILHTALLIPFIC